MTDLEQNLINEFGKLAKQYAEDQERLSGQVERLEKQVRQLHESQGEAEKGYTQWVDVMDQIQEDQLKMGNHITRLTDAYDEHQNSYRALADAFIALQKDLTELARWIHREAEQKRQSTDWRRVDGRIENLIQGRARSRGGWDFSR